MWALVILAIAFAIVVLALALRRQRREAFSDAIAAAGALRVLQMNMSVDASRLRMRFDVTADGITQDELQQTDVRGYFMFADGVRLTLEPTPFPDLAAATENVRAKLATTQATEILLDAVDKKGNVRLRVQGGGKSAGQS